MSENTNALVAKAFVTYIAKQFATDNECVEQVIMDAKDCPTLNQGTLELQLANMVNIDTRFLVSYRNERSNQYVQITCST